MHPIPRSNARLSPWRESDMLAPVEIDYDAAFESYVARFNAHCGDKPPGGFAKYGNTMIQRLSRADFDERLERYLFWHRECKRLLGSGATIADAITMEFEEAAAWVCLKAPNILEMFQGELGDPNEAIARET